MFRPLLVLVVACCGLLVSVSSQCNTPQLSCPAQSSLAEVPTPWYSLTFDTDPAAVVGPTAYNWSATDTTETCAYSHSGMVTFDGEGDSDSYSGGTSYIDLNAVSCENSPGSGVSLNNDLPYIDGHNSSGNITSGTAGWSFEVTVKAQASSLWAKFYCLGNGAGSYDISLGFVESTAAVRQGLDIIYPGGEQDRIVFDDPPGMPLNTWQHIVAVYQTLDQFSYAGRVFVYLNGELLTYPDITQYNNVPEEIVPQAYRGNSYLGRSCYASDSLFDGSIDAFRIYDRSLTAEQVSSLYYQQMAGCDVTTSYSPVINDVSPNQVASAPASTVVTPFFSLTASTDPRPAEALYGWRETDFVDTLCTYFPIADYHHGSLVFPGGPQSNPTIGVTPPYVTSNFVNLSAATGPNSLGRVLPTVGGPSSGSVDDGSAGWSFEFTLKPGMQSQWAKIMDLGSTRNVSNILQCNNDIAFGYNYRSAVFTATVCDGDGNQAPNVQMQYAEYGNWVSYVIVFQEWALNSSLSNWQLYQDGTLVTSISGTYYPQAAIRQNANLGLSGWDDPQWAGLLDTFNVYDVALSSAQVSQLHQNASGGYPGSCYEYQISYIPPDAVFFSANFSTDPAMVADPSYQWLPSDPSDNAAEQLAHQGIIVLDGSNPVDQYVDLGLASGRASVTTQPIRTFGGLGTGALSDNSLGWSFEIVFKSYAQTTWAKAFDFSNNAGEFGGSWDVQFGWQSNQQFYSVNLFYNETMQDELFDATRFPFPLNTWTSFIWVIQYDGSDTNYQQPGYDYASYITYTNGQQTIYSSYQHYIDYVDRQYGFLGRSSYNDSAWLGAIDTFNVYSIALNSEQVATLYAASIGAVSSSSSSSSTGLPSTGSFSSTGSFPSTGSPPSLSSSSSSSAVPSECDIIESEPNLLVNPGFELGDLGYNITGFGTSVDSFSFEAHCGNGWLYLGAVIVDSYINQSVSVEANTTYLFSLYVYSDGEQPNHFNATAAFFVDGSLESIAVIYAGTNLRQTNNKYVQHYALITSPPADVMLDQQVTLVFTIAAYDTPGQLRVDDLELYPANGTIPIPPPPPSSSSGMSSSSSSAPTAPYVTSSSPPPTLVNGTVYLFSYNQTLTGEYNSGISGVQFSFTLLLTAVCDGSVCLLLTATGTVTRSDSLLVAEIVRLLPVGGYASNDNLLLPFSNPVEDQPGFSMIDSDGLEYNLFFIYYDGQRYGMDLSAINPTGNNRNAYDYEGPSIALLGVVPPVASSSSSSTGPATSVMGDPQFVGLRGQSFQVHGIDGAVYALISEPAMQVNARFRFLTGPRPCPVMPSTGERCQACWSHDGSYLSEVGVLVKATSETVRAVAGNATVGFASVSVNGVQLAVAESTPTGSVELISTHELRLTAGSYRINMESVDGFVNLRSVELTVPFASVRSHGLLGQTWSSKLHRSTLKVIEGEVDDYVLAEDDVLGSDFVYSQYDVRTE